MARNDAAGLGLDWSGRWTLTHRILAVNVFALAMLAGSIFYLDSFRTRLTNARLQQSQTEVRMVAEALALTPEAARQTLIGRIGAGSRSRLRLYSASGPKLMDSWATSGPTYRLRQPRNEPFSNRVGHFLDNGFDAITGKRRPPPLEIVTLDGLGAWPEAQQALQAGRPVTRLRRAPDGTAYVTAAAPVSDGQSVLLLSANAREIRNVTRDERLTLALILLASLILSALLSLFLARTIVRPLRLLARSAQRVRLGRSREVHLPTLPARRDEIGLLARALGDMTQALRQRIDATEAFAADVSHELKNPLASLRSAVDSLERVEQPELRRQLIDVVRHDVGRIDRLIGDIAEASRLDAELTRARFEPIDLRGLAEAMLPAWEERAKEADATVTIEGTSVSIHGEESRLARVFDNLIDNALSFSPDGGVVVVRIEKEGRDALVSVEDDGPGVPPEAREAIFNRFHSIRPEGEAFGRHSGLGLAIARTIVEGHGGRIAVEDRADGRRGARFTIRLPGQVQ